jgi:hypothetical protein
MGQDTRTDIARRRVVYELAAAERVSVRRDLRYVSASGEPLPFDLYEPPPELGRAPRPAVFLVPGYNDDGMRRFAGCAAKNLGAFESWARLIAASGLSAIAYECRDPGADAGAMLAHVRASAVELGVQAARFGLWACSGHAPTAIATAMSAPAVGCMALLYGYTIDLDGDHDVADASARFRFAVPAAGRSLSDLPDTLPMLLVRAGADQMPGLNLAMDRLVRGLLARNSPLTLVNHAAGPHAFELEDDSPGTRAAIHHVLAFLTAHLER